MTLCTRTYIVRVDCRTKGPAKWPLCAQVKWYSTYGVSARDHGNTYMVWLQVFSVVTQIGFVRVPSWIKSTQKSNDLVIRSDWKSWVTIAKERNFRSKSWHSVTVREDLCHLWKTTCRTTVCEEWRDDVVRHSAPISLTTNLTSSKLDD